MLARERCSRGRARNPSITPALTFVFDQHLPQQDEHADGGGEKGKHFKREFRVMEEVKDRHHHGEGDGDHLREPRDLMLGGGAREIKEIEFAQKFSSSEAELGSVSHFDPVLL